VGVLKVRDAQCGGGWSENALPQGSAFQDDSEFTFANFALDYM